MMEKVQIDIWGFTSKKQIGVMFTEGTPRVSDHLYYEGKAYEVREVWLLDFKEASAKRCSCILVEVMEHSHKCKPPHEHK